VLQAPGLVRHEPQQLEQRLAVLQAQLCHLSLAA
jgi:hypothetical protein